MVASVKKKNIELITRTSGSSIIYKLSTLMQKFFWYLAKTTCDAQLHGTSQKVDIPQILDNLYSLPNNLHVKIYMDPCNLADVKEGFLGNIESI